MTLLGVMVEGGVGWQWWAGTLFTMAMGAGLGWALRGAVEREMRDKYEDERVEWERAQRAARVYQREIERAKRRHPSGR